MKIGMQLIFANHRDYTDAEMYKNEVKLAVEADAMGFDRITVVEHHFDDYSFCPDNAQLLSYLAAKTKNVRLMPAAFILPWNDPLRVVEKAILLDILSDGRVDLGIARGLAKMEFDGFRVPMAEARDRFDEAAEMIIAGLESGFVEGHGKFYKQPRVEIRPRRIESFADRTWMVGMSPSSVDVAARLGLGCIKFSNFPWEEALPEIETYKAGYKKTTGRNAPPIICADFIALSHDPKKAQALRDRHLREYWLSVLHHYEMRKTENFETKDGSYSSYVDAANELNSMSEQEALESWSAVNLVGTPEMVLEKLAHRRELIGDFDITVSVSAGSMPYDEVWAQTKIFVDEVMPVIKSWGTDVKTVSKSVA